mmetsp:Transcript_17128/g.59876  ORF Transcript_17128/g.59876 Transcript_17128/m.59876 type:complete len:92 (-) Transcript_17128:86-361(-)
MVPRVPIEPIAYYLVPAESSGIVEALPDFAALESRSDVIWARPMVQVGGKVVGAEDGLPTWMMDIMVKGPNAKEALDEAFRTVKANTVKVC